MKQHLPRCNGCGPWYSVWKSSACSPSTWHPYAVEPGTDCSGEAQTPVEFTLETTATGTRLRVVESSFDKLPPHRRNIAFRTNEGGWEIQMQNIARYLGDHA